MTEKVNENGFSSEEAVIGLEKEEIELIIFSLKKSIKHFNGKIDNPEKDIFNLGIIKDNLLHQVNLANSMMMQFQKILIKVRE